MDPSEVTNATSEATGSTSIDIDVVVATSESAPALSKSAKKKLAKAQRREEQKLERRAREKAAKAAKKAEQRALREKEGGSAPSKDEDSAEGGRPAKRRKLDNGDASVVPSGDGESAAANGQLHKAIVKDTFGAKIVIDLGFDDKMTEREIVSLVSQCAYSYSSNRKSSTPFSALLFTSLNGRTKARLDTLKTYQNWKGVEWWSEGYDALWDPPLSNEILAEGRSFVCPVTGTSRSRTSSQRGKVVYLTADSDVELLELQDDETYVIGGIVDKNRYKSLCENKARGQNVRTARLPIGVYLKELPTRKVLTVNQVLDILLNWVEHRDWRKALFDVMPQRKFESVGKKARRSQKRAEANVVDGIEEDEDEDAEGEDEYSTEGPGLVEAEPVIEKVDNTR